MRKPASISLLLPVHDEEAAIESKLADASARLGDAVGDFEIVVINDGSADDTGTLAEGMAAGSGLIRVLHHPKRLGYGVALRHGIAAAQKESVLIADPARRLSARELRTLLALAPRHKAVLGFADCKQGNIAKRAGMLAKTLFLDAVFGEGARDASCVLMLIDRRTLAGLALASNGSAIGAEMVGKLKSADIAVKTVRLTPTSDFAWGLAGTARSVAAFALRRLVTGARALAPAGLPREYRNLWAMILRP